MKKCTALFILAFAVFQIASAQASYTSVSYNKSSQPALMLQLPYNVEISEGFIVDNLKKISFRAIGPPRGISQPVETRKPEVEDSLQIRKY